MNTMAQSSNLHRMIVTAAFGALIGSFAAISPAADAPGMSQATVKYGDLKLSSPQGAAVLYARISATANEVCRTLDGRDLASKTRFNRCVHQAIVDAVTKVDQPALYTVYNTKNPTPKPIMLAAGQTR
jgi:UrcA family protein